MKRIGIEAIYPSAKHIETRTRQSLRGVMMEQPNHAWAMDIAFMPSVRIFAYRRPALAINRVQIGLSASIWLRR